ncbi:hypothetical protein WMY93_029053 [Mugilogobius chulae]|uniref:Uncharacterized protein n=1 Tax=Mugilogobius chulae TaxID=88201 RepID=A0AAW0N135_9GOBI
MLTLEGLGIAAGTYKPGPTSSESRPVHAARPPLQPSPVKTPFRSSTFPPCYSRRFVYNK